MKTPIDLTMTNLRLIPQSTRDHGSQFRSGLRHWTAAALLVSALIFAFRTLLYADTPNLTGTYTADDGGIYYVQQLGSTLWWIGMSLDADPHVAQVFHRGVAFTNIFKGEVRSDNTVAGQWADVSRGLTLNKGTLTLQITPASGGSGGSGFQLTALTKTGGFGASQWTPTDPISDEPSMTDRFTQVEKGASEPASLHANGLQAFRDETVFYGRVTSKHVNGGVKDEVPQFFDTTGDRSYSTFICDSSDHDHDMEINIGVDRTRFESIFLTSGWGDFDIPSVTQKLNDNTVQGPAGLQPNEGYIHAEGLMYGHTAKCGAGTGRVLFPGWADKGGNSILINGRPIDGADNPDNMQLAYAYDVNTQSYYVEGLRINNQLLLPGDQIRITGSLILDCGHWDWDTLNDSCHTGKTYSDDNESQNQEIHPIYSIDIIRPPLGTGAYQARQNLTGAWGSDDGGTFYVRQIGNTVWMLGLSRSREALLKWAGTASPPILTYANVFQGTISDNPDGTETILGTGETVPYASAEGGIAYTGGILVAANRKDMTRDACNPFCPSALPHQFSKLYEPEDTTPPQSTLAIGAPQYPVGASQPFVTGATAFTLTTTDVDSGVQNVWYRFFPSGSANPPSYTSANGSSATFHLSGADGLYEVDSYATDNAGNDETAHSQTVYLDTTAPVATIVQPTATQYLHSDSFTISYSVSDGTGSGVKSATPNIDGLTVLKDNTPVANNQKVYLLTALMVGTHTFTVNSVDNLNNSGSNSVTFSIIVTAASIKAEVRQFLAAGKITQDEATSLLSKLSSAAKARAKGDCANAATIYTSFISEVQAQSGKKIDPTAAQILIADAQYLIAHCP